MKPYRYRTAVESMKPGYLEKRFAAYKRLQRMQARASNVQPLPKKATNGR
jgi:hypothetical protein